MNYQAVTGIVMAGGKSRRMGADKGLVLFNGEPLILYAIRLLQPFCTKVLISTNNADYSKFGCTLVNDLVPGLGPISGISSALKQSVTEINLVISCDMPLMSPVVINKILEYSGQFKYVVPVDESGRPEPLCALYTRSSLSQIEHQMVTKQYKLALLFNDESTKLISPGEFGSEYNEAWFTNVNSPRDLRNQESQF